MTDAIYINNDNVLELQTLTDALTSTAITDATVTVTLLDAAGDEVYGQNWPVTMTHISAGTYRATLEDGLVLSLHEEYTARIDVDAGGDNIGQWDFPLVAEKRRS